MITSAIIPRPLAKLPWRLIFIVLGIALFGLIVLYSAAGGSIRPWSLKQAVVFLGFLAIAIAMSWLKESTIKAIAFPLYGITLVMLVGVEGLGFVSKGAKRWLDLGPIRLQPSEFMKPAIVLTLARFYELVPAAEIRKWRAIWPALALLGVPALLILVQPDLGTCIMVLLCGVTVMFLAGLPWWLFVAPLAAVGVAAPIVYSMMHGYQQSKIAIGSGGIWGKGFLHGSQSHLQYLPEGHTDFVFATMAEEWGLVGGVILICAFAAVIHWGMRVSQNARTRFAQLAAAGLSATIFFYVSINLLMVMGLAPVVGVPLPLVSFGGSAVMTVMLCLGLLMALERQQRTVSRLI
jgi:rod shape determining protein RodA